MTKREEITINTFLENGIKNRYQIVMINDHVIGTDGIETSLCITKFQIRKNRKILCTFKNENDAKRKFFIIIREKLIQTKLF